MNPLQEGARLALADAASHLGHEATKFADEALNDVPSDVSIQDIDDWVEYWRLCVANYRIHFPKENQT